MIQGLLNNPAILSEIKAGKMESKAVDLASK